MAGLMSFELQGRPGIDIDWTIWTMMRTSYTTPCLVLFEFFLHVDRKTVEELSILTEASDHNITLELVFALVSDIQVQLDLPCLIAYQLSLRTPSLSPSSVATMAAHVFGLDELSRRIATHLLAVSPKSTVAFALTCRALEVSALRTPYEAQSYLLSRFMRVFSTDMWYFLFPGNKDFYGVGR